MERIQVKFIKEILGSHEAVTIINVLPHESFRKEHIPGSKNIPFDDEVEFIQAVERIVPSKEHKVIVYCSNKDCSLSTKAAKALDEAGFHSILRFEGGIEEWKNAGEKVESSSRHHVRH